MNSVTCMQKTLWSFMLKMFSNAEKVVFTSWEKEIAVLVTCMFVKKTIKKTKFHQKKHQKNCQKNQISSKKLAVFVNFWSGKVVFIKKPSRQRVSFWRHYFRSGKGHSWEEATANSQCSVCEGSWKAQWRGT